MDKNKDAAGSVCGMIEGGGNSSPDVAADTATAHDFSKETIGAATSKLISASIGDIAMLFSRDLAAKADTSAGGAG